MIVTSKWTGATVALALFAVGCGGTPSPNQQAANRNQTGRQSVNGQNQHDPMGGQSTQNSSDTRSGYANDNRGGYANDNRSNYPSDSRNDYTTEARAKYGTVVNAKYLPVGDGRAANLPMSDGLQPREVVQAAYAAANSHRYALADKFLCSTARRISTSPELMQYWDHWTRDGRVDRLKIEGENIRGAQAQVRLVIEYADGSESDEISENLIHEADGWRMNYPGDDAATATGAQGRGLTR